MKDFSYALGMVIGHNLKGSGIYSYPMKGTIDASLPNARQELMDDKKEAAEHATIVDLIRNDLSRVASGVRVDRYRYIETLHTNKGDILHSLQQKRRYTRQQRFSGIYVHPQVLLPR